MSKQFKIMLAIVGIIAVILLVLEFAANYTYKNSPDFGDDIALYNELSLQNENSITTIDAQIDKIETDDSNSADNSDVTSQAETQTEINIKSETNIKPNLQTMVLAGGCFWCVEADMEKAPGVIAVVSGYSGGSLANPTYKTYGDGGHREVVQVIYDANQINYRGLLYYFVKHIDPTDGEGSFVDRGVEYSPAIYYANDSEQKIALAVLTDIESQNVYDKPLATPVIAQSAFWPAEDYHQDFYKKSVVRYKTYRASSGRDAFVNKYWGDQADVIPNI